MSDIRCRIGIHDWNKYGDIINAYGGLCQFKSCKRCHKIQWTEIYGNQAKPELINETIKAASK